MSQVKRYTPSMKPGLMLVDSDGLWVRWQDIEQVTAERDALQQRLTAADERNDEAIDLLRRARAVIEGGGWADLERGYRHLLQAGRRQITIDTA